jgi:hypothetical protein
MVTLPAAITIVVAARVTGAPAQTSFGVAVGVLMMGNALTVTVVLAVVAQPNVASVAVTV